MISTEFKPDVYIVKHEYANLWVSKNTEENVNYYYGGTRTVHYNLADEEVCAKINYLKTYESGLKNAIINAALNDHAFDSLVDELPAGFLDSKVGGGRCVIQPKSAELEDIITDVKHPRHTEVIDSLFSALGEFLNLKGEIKLTPDFGRFAGLADQLNKYTENVLGIACENGGCGGKASYTSTGIIQAIKSLGHEEAKNLPITLIGSEGACGCGVLDFLIQDGYTDIAVCDLAYDHADKYGNRCTAPDGITVLPSEPEKFTDECLERGGIIVATTVGGELLNSDCSKIKDGTLLLLAHNEAIPCGREGVEFIDALLANKDITIIPGQFLTFGGALTSRVECFWRQSNKGTYFNKPLAHKVVCCGTDYWMNKLQNELKTEKNLYKYLYTLLITPLSN